MSQEIKFDDFVATFKRSTVNQTVQTVLQSVILLRGTMKIMSYEEKLVLVEALAGITQELSDSLFTSNGEQENGKKN